MTIGYRFFLPLWVICFALFAAKTYAADCAALPKNQTFLQLEFAKPQLDTSLSFDQLAELSGRMRVREAQGLVRLGFVVSHWIVTYEVESVFGATQNGQICGAPTKIILRFGYDRNQVYLGHELMRSACLRDEIFAHEMQHLRARQQMVIAYGKILQAAIDDKAGRLRGVIGPSQQSVDQRITAEIDSVIQVVGKAALTEEAGLQGRIDTDSEYVRLAKSCGGQLRRLVKVK